MTTQAKHMAERTIEPMAPFDFAKSLDFLCGFPATVAEQLVEDGRLIKALRVDRTTVVAEVVGTGTTARPELQCKLHSAKRLPPDTENRAFERVRFYLSTDENLGEFYDLASSDNAFLNVVRKLHGYHQVKFPSPFENACWAVLGQRCPISVARKMKDRFVAQFGGVLSFSDVELRAFPEPADLDDVTEEEIGACIGNPVKAHRIRAVADAFRRVDESFLKVAPSEEVRTWLEAIDGIGPWSSNFIMVRGLGRTDTLAGIEESLLPAVSKLYGAPASRTDVQRIAARYGTWQGYWAHYVRVAA